MVRIAVVVLRYNCIRWEGEYYSSIVGDKITGPFQIIITFLLIRLLQLKNFQIKA